MPSRRLDYDDAYTTRFDGFVTDLGVHHGRPAVELEFTYFYPEGGGQEADRGTLGRSAVLDVQSDAGRVWHILESTSIEPGARVDARVDWSRRFDNMQQHTGQHVLSAAIEHELGADTLSSHLGDTRSTIEVSLDDVDWKAVERLERAANRVVWENRPIERHWVDDEGVKRFKLRKPPKFTGTIRIVEIPDWDVSACGGTHTLHTGEVGVIKIVRWERVRGNVRFEFLCGGRALADYGWRTETLLEAARRRTLKDTELIAHLERAASERDELKKQVQEMSQRLVREEARQMVGNGARGVTAFFESRPRDELRTLAIQSLDLGAPWAVVGAGAPDPTVILVRARAKQGANFRDLLPELLERADGKGGGSPDFLTVAAANEAAARDAWGWGCKAVVEAMRGPD